MWLPATVPAFYYQKRGAPMESLAEAVKAADGPWPVLAIAIIGLYVLVWRFGGRLIALALEGNLTAAAAHKEVQQVAESIVTNHGSKNLGDAVDRLTEQVGLLHARMSTLEQRFDDAA